jgi:hypothetical protein
LIKSGQQSCERFGSRVDGIAWNAYIRKASSGASAQASLKTSQEVAALNGDNKSSARSDLGSLPQGWEPLSFGGVVPKERDFKLRHYRFGSAA